MRIHLQELLFIGFAEFKKCRRRQHKTMLTSCHTFHIVDANNSCDIGNLRSSTTPQTSVYFKSWEIHRAKFKISALANWNAHSKG